MPVVLASSVRRGSFLPRFLRAAGTLAAKELGSLTASTGDFAQHSTGGHSDDIDIPQSTVGAADVISRPYRETVGAAEVISRPYR